MVSVSTSEFFCASMTYHNIKQYAAFSDGFDLMLNLRAVALRFELLMIMFDDDPLWLIFWRHLRILLQIKHSHTHRLGTLGLLLVH